MRTQILRFTDKDKRNEAFENLRKHGDECERQAVKYSDVEEGKTFWYISYPMDIDEQGHSRKDRRLRRERSRA